MTKPEIRDKDGWTIVTVEAHDGGIALIQDTYGSKTRLWFTPTTAKMLAAELLVAANRGPEGRPD